MIDPLLLAFVELTLVMVLILLLHSVKHLIGPQAFYLSLGLFLVLGQVVSAFGIQIDPGIGGLTLDVGNVVLTSPFLVALLLIYILDGTLEAQRVIIGFLALLVGYLCLSMLLTTQFTLPGYTSRQPELLRYLHMSLSRGRSVANATFVASAVDLFVLPILYQFFQNTRCRLFISVLGTLLLTQVIDSFIFQLLVNPQLSNWWDALRTSYLARAAAMTWLSILASLYLHMTRGTSAQSHRPSLDIVFAFLGGYGRAEILRRNIIEWEGRYRTVIESTSDWIFVLDQDAVLLSANAAARAYLGDVQGQSVRALEIFHDANGDTIAWDPIWDKLCENATAPSPHYALSREWLTQLHSDDTGDPAPLRLDVQISPATMEETLVAICIARDVTEQRQLEREQAALRERVAMIQRLESVGVLAGGVAHDFNNLLHTVQAGVDRLRRRDDTPPEGRTLLDTMDESLHRASRLTTHLLGFARRGKYNPERITIQDILDDIAALFEPLLVKDDIEFRRLETPDSVYLVADRTQLEQVFLNMLINSRDALRMEEQPGRIVLRAERASEYTPGWSVRPEDHRDAQPQQFSCIRVKDNGPGIPPEVRDTLFEPFVTTKEVGHGTGMGLAMAYGCITHHGGWIHVDTSPKGTEFLVFLPCST